MTRVHADGSVESKMYLGGHLEMQAAYTRCPRGSRRRAPSASRRAARDHPVEGGATNPALLRITVRMSLLTTATSWLPCRTRIGRIPWAVGAALLPLAHLLSSCRRNRAGGVAHWNRRMNSSEDLVVTLSHPDCKSTSGMCTDSEMDGSKHSYRSGSTSASKTSFRPFVWVHRTRCRVHLRSASRAGPAVPTRASRRPCSMHERTPSMVAGFYPLCDRSRCSSAKRFPVEERAVFVELPSCSTLRSSRRPR